MESEKKSTPQMEEQEYILLTKRITRPKQIGTDIRRHGVMGNLLLMLLQATIAILRKDKVPLNAYIGLLRQMDGDMSTASGTATQITSIDIDALRQQGQGGKQL